jgi:hypothetical protein
MRTHSCDKVAVGIVTTTKQGKKGLDKDGGEMQAAWPRDAVMPCVVSIPVARVVVTNDHGSLCAGRTARSSPCIATLGCPPSDSSRLRAGGSAARQAGGAG